MEDQVPSGFWSEEERILSMNVREFLAVERGLLSFLPFLQDCSVTVFCDNMTALSYLRHQGGALSPRLNSIAQRILRWTEVLFFPQFVMGKSNVVADSLSRPDQIIGPEWTLHQEVLDSSQAVASDGGLVRHLTESPLTCVFCSNVGPDCGCDRRHVATLGPSSGVCLSPGGHVKSGIVKDQGLCRSSGNTNSFPMAIQGMVSRPSSSAIGTSDSIAASMGSSSTATREKVSPAPVVASSSCVRPCSDSLFSSGSTA